MGRVLGSLFVHAVVCGFTTENENHDGVYEIGTYMRVFRRIAVRKVAAAGFKPTADKEISLSF